MSRNTRSPGSKGRGEGGTLFSINRGPDATLTGKGPYRLWAPAANMAATQAAATSASVAPGLMAAQAGWRPGAAAAPRPPAPPDAPAPPHHGQLGLGLHRLEVQVVRGEVQDGHQPQGRAQPVGKEVREEVLAHEA